MQTKTITADELQIGDVVVSLARRRFDPAWRATGPLVAKTWSSRRLMWRLQWGGDIMPWQDAYPGHEFEIANEDVISVNPVEVSR